MRYLETMRLLLSLIAAATCAIAAELPPWEPGMLDIHQISTGQGNSAFFIFPDGTTMLLDAGDRGLPSLVGARPNNSRTPGEWITRYIKRMLPAGSPQEIDYFVLTHFHDDHWGHLGPETKTAASGAYRLSGVTEVGDSLPFHLVLDRGWPDYQYPYPTAQQGPLQRPLYHNYRAFLKWQAEHHGTKVERFRAGRKDQIVLRRDRTGFPDFEVRNIAVNGEIWIGVGDTTKSHFPPVESLPREDLPTENMCCIGFRLHYGKFDYFSGGDIPGTPPAGFPAWHDVETPVAKVVGPVEVLLLNHHGNMDSQNAFFLSMLLPRVEIFSVWSKDHPGQAVLDRLLSQRVYPGPRDIFATQMSPANREVIGPRLMDQLKSTEGHVVVRVGLGGANFHVYILDDLTESYAVTAVHGPYDCK
jgi:hypothetical protein